MLQILQTAIIKQSTRLSAAWKYMYENLKAVDALFYIACADGFYGYECVNNCSGNCKNGMYCNKENGQCDLGCIPGFTNIFCEDSK